jgi:hypothetical protein
MLEKDGKPTKEMPLAAKKSGLRSDLNPDPGSDFFPSRILDPNCFHLGSRIRIKEFKYWSVLRIRDVYPGSRILIFTHPGSRIQL